MEKESEMKLERLFQVERRELQMNKVVKTNQKSNNNNKRL